MLAFSGGLYLKIPEGYKNDSDCIFDFHCIKVAF